jgi:hypothetical protein
MRTLLLLVVGLLSACGSAELTVHLEVDPSVSGTVVWFRPIVRELPSSTPVIYEAQRVGDGEIRIPFPEDGRAFSLRIDACDEGEGCDVSRRMAVACSKVLRVQSGEAQAPIRLTLMAVQQPDPGGCP